MKIGDIEIGKEYAASDGNRLGRYNSDLPRRVTALSIETVEKEVWVGHGFSNQRSKRKVRQVKVRLEDEPRQAASSWRSNDILSGEEGKELVVEARFLVALWKDVRADVKRRITEQQMSADAKAAYTARINALLPKKLQDDYHSVTAHTNESRKTVRVEARLDGEILETILKLAEAGKHLEDMGTIRRPKKAAGEATS